MHKQAMQIVVPLIVIFVFAVHWSAIGSSLWNLSFLKQSPPPVVKQYVGTLFHQEWKMFAPEAPRFSKKFYFRCGFEEGVSEWQDPIQPLLAKHYKNRLASHGRRLRVPIGFAMWIGRHYGRLHYQLSCEDGEKTCETDVRTQLQKHPVYKAAVQYASGLCEERFASQSIQAVQLQIAQKHIVARDHDVSYKFSRLIFAPERTDL